MARRRTRVERAMQRAHGLPDDRAPADDGWRDGAGGTRYFKVSLDAEWTPREQPLSESLFLSSQGWTTRYIGVSDKETFGTKLDPNGLR